MKTSHMMSGSCGLPVMKPVTRRPVAASMTALKRSQKRARAHAIPDDATDEEQLSRVTALWGPGKYFVPCALGGGSNVLPALDLRLRS